MPQAVVDKERSVLGETTLIALGGNVGSAAGGPELAIRQAMDALSEIGVVTGRSRLYRSPAFPAGSGPDYVNAAVAVRSDLLPGEILLKLHGIETRFGRVRKDRWGARTLDLDLIAVGSHVHPDLRTWTLWRDLPLERQLSETPEDLILPHPRLQDRAFVLLPLAEIAPHWRHPVTGLDVTAMCAELPEPERAALVALD